MNLLLDKGAEVNAKDSSSCTALIFAAQNGHTEIVRTLLDKGAAVNATNYKSETALMYAARNSQVNIVKILKNASPKKPHPDSVPPATRPVENSWANRHRRKRAGGASGVRDDHRGRSGGRRDLEKLVEKGRVRAREGRS